MAGSLLPKLIVNSFQLRPPWIDQVETGTKQLALDFSVNKVLNKLRKELEMGQIEVSVVNPLWDSDFEAAAYLCLEAASLTDRDQFPPGSGDMICRTLHDRRKRFEEAREKRMRGASSLLDLGLRAEDCAWAAKQKRRALDPKGWELRFRTAETRLIAAALQPKDPIKTT